MFIFWTFAIQVSLTEDLKRAFIGHFLAFFASGTRVDANIAEPANKVIGAKSMYNYSNKTTRNAEKHVMKYYPGTINFEDKPLVKQTNVDIQTEYDLGFAFMIHNMDREAMDIFTNLINDDDEKATTLALKLAAMYND